MSGGLLFIRMFVFDQLSGFNIQIPAKFADQRRIDPLEVVAALPVEIGTWDIQIFADLIFADTFCL